MGIVNGTTNFILTKMTEEGADYAAALAEAQALGFAERDPTADVEGFDAGAKAAIMATIAFGSKVVAGDVYHEGISGDHRRRHRDGQAPRLRRQAARHRRDRRRHGRRRRPRAPGDGPVDHPLASVASSYNAVFVEGAAVGSLMFYGRGAGGLPTASAVLGDVIDAAVNLSKGTHGSIGSFGRAHIRPIDETSAEYLLSLDVARPARRAARGHRRVRPPRRQHPRRRSRRATGRRPGWCSSPTRHASRRCRQRVRELRDLDVVRNVGGLLRVIGG